MRYKCPKQVRGVGHSSSLPLNSNNIYIGYTWFGLEFLFDFFIHLSMILGVFATAHAAVVTVYGPSVALKGAEPNVVLLVAEKMREQRKFVLQIGVLTLISLLFAMLFNFWAKVPLVVCVSSTVLYMAGFVLCVTEGVRCYNLFHPDKEVMITVRGIISTLKVLNVKSLLSMLMCMHDFMVTTVE